VWLEVRENLLVVDREQCSTFVTRVLYHEPIVSKYRVWPHGEGSAEVLGLVEVPLVHLPGIVLGSRWVSSLGASLALQASHIQTAEQLTTQPEYPRERS